MPSSLSPVPPTVPLRIAILEADDVLDQYGRYGGLYTSLLQAAAGSLGWPHDRLDISAWDVVNAKEGNVWGYPRLDDVDAVLISGSSESRWDVLDFREDPEANFGSWVVETRHMLWVDAYEDHDWILRLVEFTKEVLAQTRVRLIGVCFGHQITGRALGAPVARSEKGYELSVIKLNLTAKGKEIFDGKDVLSIMSMHRDIIVDNAGTVGPLQDLEPLAFTSHTENQSMYQARRLITVQGHPEFNQEIVCELLKTRRRQNLYSQETFESAMERSGNVQEGLVVGRAFLRFLVEDEADG
ncbi:hypothetical protein MMC07_002098 [Pseudocyphellaria aurata]|nr:hypothetical protein [Pseudocyphellaria aurata]